jgi:pimeloyl-ACP methyl ester carboxylesterase
VQNPLKIALVAAILAGSLAGSPAGTADAAETSPSQLTWSDCGDPTLDPLGAQCAQVTVPLDYSRPYGPTIKIAISRIKATDPARRRGILVGNPGGPGAGGLTLMADLTSSLSPDVRAQYDLIGVDPRGTGRSAPVDCDWSTGQMLRSAGFDRQGFDEIEGLEASLAARCQAKQGAVLPYLTTRNAARDMDRIRAALGEPKLSYIGFSYGTYLGAVYTQMFPGRSDRVVLDSAVDPDRITGLQQDMGPASEKGLDSWSAWAAGHDDEYHFGTTQAAVRSFVENLIATAARKPIKIGGYTVDEHLLPVVLWDGLIRDDQNALLASYVRQLGDAATGKAVTITPEFADELASQVDPSQFASAFAVIICGDAAAPRDPEAYWRAIQSVRATEPVFGALSQNLSACAFWPRPREAPTVVHNSAPALIVHSSEDTRVAYPQAVALHRMLTGSRLVTLQGVRFHSLFGRVDNPCANNSVNDYLATGVLPSTDKVC